MSPEGIPEQALAQLIGALLACCLTPVHLAVSIWICFIIQAALKRVPAEFRRIDPLLPWLRMVAFVPGVGAVVLLILNFFILPATSKSIAAAEAARGGQVAGDGGTRMAWITCWLDVVAAMLFTIGAGLLVATVISASPQGAPLSALQTGNFERANPALLLAALGAMSAASLACLLSLIVFCFWLVKINGSGK